MTSYSDNNHDAEAASTRRQEVSHDSRYMSTPASEAAPALPTTARSLAKHLQRGTQANASLRIAAMQSMQRTYGNAASRRAVQRSMEGRGGSNAIATSKGSAYAPVQRAEDEFMWEYEESPEMIEQIENEHGQAEWQELEPEAAPEVSEAPTEYPYEEQFQERLPGEEEYLAEEEAATEAAPEAVETAPEIAESVPEIAETVPEIVETVPEIVEGVELAEGGVAVAEGGAVAAEAGAAAGGLGAGAVLPVAAAGLVGFGIGTAIGEYGIDPYLNRPHTEPVADIDTNYKDSWAYKVNQWLDD